MTSGILIVDKPRGWTSFDVVGFVRRRSGVKRVGHAGTLDPMATGVLPLLLGDATRLAEYLVDATKAYTAEIELGLETDTYDAEGRVVRRLDTGHIGREQIEAALEPFRGEILQTPPAFSAIKRGGVPLYRLARQGQQLEVEPRRVRIDALRLLSYQPPRLALEIVCSKGFYVRSLAHDVGAALGVGGSLTGLVRSRVGTFSLEAAVTPEQLAVEIEDGSWRERLWPPDEIVLHWPAAVLGEANCRRLSHGAEVALGDTPAAAVATRCRAYSAAGDFLALLALKGSVWQPEKVFAAGNA